MVATSLTGTRPEKQSSPLTQRFRISRRRLLVRALTLPVAVCLNVHRPCASVAETLQKSNVAVYPFLYQGTFSERGGG